MPSALEPALCAPHCNISSGWRYNQNGPTAYCGRLDQPGAWMATQLVISIGWELALFAGAIGLIFALDDLAVDAFWLAGQRRRIGRLGVLGTPTAPALNYAILVPAWCEANVIGAMLQHLDAVWAPKSGARRYKVYVGAYANDIQTIAEMARMAGRTEWLQMVIVPHAGPTTKGDCLNQLWQRLQADIAAARVQADAVIIHDAEDRVAMAELLAHDHALPGADYAQLPVKPLLHPAGRWMSGHYADEFAESHLKEMAVRDAMGALMPTAGVGCAIRIGALQALCTSGEAPFNAATLTEDYALGLSLAEQGRVGRMALFKDADGQLVATESLFPHRFERAVRQKTRWAVGIALSGWDAHAWRVPVRADELQALLCRWMLWRDRRTLLCALALIAGYASVLLLAPVAWLDTPALARLNDDALVRAGAWLMLCLLGWRLIVRTGFSVAMHGWRVGIFAAPRQVISNIVLVACSWRALRAYCRSRLGKAAIWDKTEHEFPVLELFARRAS